MSDLPIPETWRPFVKKDSLEKESPELPPAMRAKSLVSKLAEVMAAVERVPKHGRNDFHKYDYATEADIAAVIRKELASRRVMLIPCVLSEKREPVGDKGDVLTTLQLEMTLLDGDSGESINRLWAGWGTDKGDKGGYKAMTGAEKYFLLKTFLIPTGDDPERDDAKGQRPSARKTVAAPPDRVVNTKTGEEVPASQRPEPPAGFKYIDGYNLDSGGWHHVIFTNADAQGGALEFKTKLEHLGRLAANAFQMGIPVHIESAGVLLKKIEQWKPEQHALPVLESEIF